MFIGFRYYTPRGGKVDKDGKKFDGWSCRFDEWIPLWSIKIAKLYTYTKKKYSKFQPVIKDPIDDSSDPNIKENETQVYAVIRPKLNKSYLLIECLNLFGSEGGYDKILELLANTLLIDFQLLDDLLNWLDICLPMYHRDFIRKFVPDLKNAIEGMIQTIPTIDYKNINQSTIRNILSSLVNILRRVYSVEKMNDEIEALKLSFILVFVKSHDQDLFVDGMKMLNNIFSEIMGQYSTISPEFMKTWIDENQILNFIFDPDIHSIKSIQMSRSIIGFYIIHGLVDDKEIDTLWSATKLSTEVQNEIYDIVFYLSDVMDEKHKIKFLNKIKQDTTDIINGELIELVYELSHSESNDASNTMLASDILYQF